MTSPRAWLALLLLIAAGPAAGAGEPVDRPNLVLIVGDDHGYPYSGFMGSPVVETPTLDHLARGGTVFTTAYATASGCRPSLFSLLTGLHARQGWALPQPAETPARGRVASLGTLPTLLAERGYASFQAGKWWEGSYADVGFSEGTKTASVRGSLMVTFMGGADGLRIGRETMQPVHDFIDRQQETPFFLWFAPLLPHQPWDAPQRYHDRYAGKGLSRSAVAYYANISRLDDAIADLVIHLDLRGLLSRTLIVYVSDNGFRQDPHEESRGFEGSGPGGKGWMNELGFRTPLVFYWRGHVPGGVVRDDLVSTLDVFPTLLDYAGVPVPGNRVGVSLRPRIEGRAGPPHGELVGHMQNATPHLGGDGAPDAPAAQAYFLRNARWHYVWYPERGDDQLYDVQADPEERKNVLAEHPELAEEFRRRIRAWEEGLPPALEAGPAGSAPSEGRGAPGDAVASPRWGR